MAALTKEQWLSVNQSLLHGNAVLYLVDKVWEAATALAEEKFKSTNSQSNAIALLQRWLDSSCYDSFPKMNKLVDDTKKWLGVAQQHT
jgi:hypothetical protein